ncbi:MAG: histidine kinase [Candidatus Acidiferrum sp.]
MSTYSGPVFNREGDVELVAGSTRDITERKRVESELRQAQARLRDLAASLESQVQARTSELEIRTNDVVFQSEQLRELSMRLMTTQDEERRRIAREMHDGAGQIITVLTMNLEQISSQVGDTSPKLRELVNQARSLVKELEQEIRTTSYLLIRRCWMSLAFGRHCFGMSRVWSSEQAFECASLWQNSVDCPLNWN